jgi:hypothetical protein
MVMMLHGALVKVTEVVVLVVLVLETEMLDQEDHFLDLNIQSLD